MFDISPEDILQLTDVELRELVGRLCEAELVSLGLSPAAATWGGNQTATDGGVDVRVELPPGTVIAGFIPCRVTGLQVKKSDMPKSAIVAEMRPPPDPPVKVVAGAAPVLDNIRPVIETLASTAGAYIIVSAAGTTTDSALKNRRAAMRDTLKGVPNEAQLITDFYDRHRLVSWVRRHPGVLAWVKEKVGKTIVGWRSYGAWTGRADDVKDDYLADDTVRLRLNGRRFGAPLTVCDAIDDIRDELALPGKIVRLVGLSGVGKTRFAQALFDERIGARPLPRALAIYTNGTQAPQPSPAALVSDLLANRLRAIMLVDNCPADLHRELAQSCSGADSTVSVLTIEYDVRDDQPEGTRTVTLEPSSAELLEKLVLLRRPAMSHVDAHSIALAAGGNARIAIALIDAVERFGSIGALSNDELFQRLFRQRNDPSDGLLHAAQACSLVYAFDGETLDGAAAELPRLACLAGQTNLETHRHLGELLRRDLVQQRQSWRSVLPHAIANRLAARALVDTPYALIEQHLLAPGAERLARSFCHRLSFLHEEPAAIKIVGKWLQPAGMLGNVPGFDAHTAVMFDEVACVLPEAALAALERAANTAPALATRAWSRHLSILRSLAYGCDLFERSCQLMVRVVAESEDAHDASEAADIFAALFTIEFSGTHASLAQRLTIIEALLKSGNARQCELGLKALDRLLLTVDGLREEGDLGSDHDYSFGARSRDYGLRPVDGAAVTEWYGAAVNMIERLALAEGLLKRELWNVLRAHFSELWAHNFDALDRICRALAADGFALETWMACCSAPAYNGPRYTLEAAARLSVLKADLAPGLADQVKLALNSSFGVRWLLDRVQDTTLSLPERRTAIIRQLGATAASDAVALAQIMPLITSGGSRAIDFGRGLASASTGHLATWTILAAAIEQVPPVPSNFDVLWGFLDELRGRDAPLAHRLLNEVAPDSALYAHVVQLAEAPPTEIRAGQT